jgi:dihydrofolate reductase
VVYSLRLHSDCGRPTTIFYTTFAYLYTQARNSRHTYGQRGTRWPNIIQQFLNGGFVDEFFIHIASVFLESGTRLFDGMDKDKYDIEILEVIPSALTTHLRYKLTKK